MPGAWVYGVVINLMGSVCINGGTNLMKHGHNLRQKLIVCLSILRHTRPVLPVAPEYSLPPPLNLPHPNPPHS